MTARRILVTGSRDWTDAERVNSELAAAWWDLGAGQTLILVSGNCPTGADAMAEAAWKAHGLTVEPHPADWPTCATGCRPGHRRRRTDGTEYCPDAGPRRNREMVALGADLCLAFIRNGSRGAAGCADLADEAGIPVRRFTQEDRR